MSQNIDTILILGATSGLGEQFARRFHAQGKKVIAAGRRIQRLAALQKELSGLEILQIDVEDLAALPKKLDTVIKDFPHLDSVFVMSGKMETSDFKDASTSTDESIISEITTNFTAPMIIARTVIPHLLSINRPATFITVSSGLAFIPLPTFPVYNGTKAAIHTLSVVLRSQLHGTNVNVIELAPPYVDTDLDKNIRETVIELQGGAEKAAKPMPLKEYIDSAIQGLELKDGVPPKEVATGFSEMGVTAWRKAFQPILDMVHMQG